MMGNSLAVQQQEWTGVWERGALEIRQGGDVSWARPYMPREGWIIILGAIQGQSRDSLDCPICYNQ